ncbi:MAG: hypothetical protein E7311_06450 [Clostridiales bacterium]|nr:hypothetical protein [Clostridiales bacterium]
MNIDIALFMELFCSIHMSVFFLMPLAKIKNPENFKDTFLKYFFIRAIVLFIGNFINPFICILDFFTIFIGAFIIIPLISNSSNYNIFENKNDTLDSNKYIHISNKKYSYKTNKKFYKKDHEYIPNKNIPDVILEKNGILNPSLFKEELYTIFITYLNAYSNIDYSTLSSICTSLHFHVVSNKLNYFEKTKEKSIYRNFYKNNITIDDIDNYGHAQTVSAIMDVDFDSFKTDSNGNSYNNHNCQKFNVIFVKNNRHISDIKECKNCGAPVSKIDLKCDYCGSIINSKINWKINSIRKVYITELEEKNYIEFK